MSVKRIAFKWTHNIRERKFKYLENSIWDMSLQLKDIYYYRMDISKLGPEISSKHYKKNFWVSIQMLLFVYISLNGFIMIKIYCINRISLSFSITSIVIYILPWPNCIDTCLIHKDTCTHIIYITHTYIYIYACTHSYIYVHIHTHTCAYIHTHTHIYICAYTHTHTHIYIYVRTHTHTHTHTHIYEHTHTHTHTYVHTHTHTHMCTHTHIYIYIYIYIPIHKNIYMETHRYIYAHTHIHTHVS